MESALFVLRVPMLLLMAVLTVDLTSTYREASAPAFLAMPTTQPGCAPVVLSCPTVS